MYCIKCGTEIEEDEKFCHQCGALQGSADGVQQGVKEIGKKKKRWPFILCGALLLVVAIVLILVFFVAGGKGKKYEEQLALAERYMDELDYDRAMAAYYAAIEIDPSRAEAYEGLADIFEVQGETQKALDILKEGYEACGERQLKKRMEKLEEKLVAASEPAIAKPAEGDPADGGEALPGEEEDGPGMLALLLVNASDKAAVSGATVTIQDGSGTYSRSGSSITNGRVELEYPGRGDYKLTVTAQDYSVRTLEFSLEPGYNEKIIPLVPKPSESNLYILLEWDGEQDLDLCGYNSEVQEYVNISHRWLDSPAQSAGDYFYIDNGAADRYELMSFSRYSEPNGVDKKVYVIDTYVVQNGGRSDMEKLGVTVSAYDQAGELFHSKANPSEDAALWYPCYYRDGKVYATDEYIYNLDGEYDWADLGIHNRAGIKLTKEDRALLFDLSYTMMCIISADQKLENRAQLQQYIRDHLEVFVSNFAYRHFESVRKETEGEYGMEIKYYYEPKEIEKTINDLFGMSVDLSRDLGNNGEPDWSDSGVGGCNYENGCLCVYYFEGGEPSDYTNYFSNKTMNGKLQLVYSFHNQYAFDYDTGEGYTLGYLNIYLKPSGNDLGYEVDSAEYEHIMDW